MDTWAKDVPVRLSRDVDEGGWKLVSRFSEKDNHRRKGYLNVAWRTLRSICSYEIPGVPIKSCTKEVRLPNYLFEGH